MNDHNKYNDDDPQETKEWLEAFSNVLREQGSLRANFLLEQLHQKASLAGVNLKGGYTTPYLNTISPEHEKPIPPDEGMSKRISALIRWNAVATVLRAGKKAPELGGHIASYASAATLYEVGFNHFFKGNKNGPGDLIFFQGHCAPGIYARAFLEGRLDENDLDHFRTEALTKGLSSYPHPWMMPNFWQLPTVSMGLGPLQAIYQARFLKYLENRGLQDTKGRRVWAFLGDGEMDEPESLGAITVAAREKLDNLTFVINCNLQRLDGPVRGNGKIIQELEGVFRGAGWHVIKVLWGRRWDPLIAKDKDGLLLKRMEECVDGDYQSYKARDGAFVREHFFGKYPELAESVAHLTDDEIWRLNRGGHDPHRVFAAYTEALATKDQPVVILAKTVKGYGMGAAGEGQNITHQQKKMGKEDLIAFRDRFQLPINDDEIEKVPYYRPEKDAPEIKYLQKQREALGGYLPERVASNEKLEIPELSAFDSVLKGSGEREISTTMAFVRLLTTLLKDKNIGKRIVPIIPDECRTFGMEGLFRQFGIYSSVGQLYTPEDADQLMFYKEAKDGQIFEEGITEPGAFSSWMAAATSYATNQLPMVPFYIYYSMFGFQRVGDLAWAAGDMRARGFLLGGTAGRTTLAGEGLQHTDGHSHVMANTIPNCHSYDPTYAYELAVIIHYGLKRMYSENHDEFYYITVMNENYHMPQMPEGIEEGIIKGLYLFKEFKSQSDKTITLFGSGAILNEVLKAASSLNESYDISVKVYSVTSFNNLARDMIKIERENRLNPDKSKPNYVQEVLADDKTPIVAATDYIRSYSEQIRVGLNNPYVTLGTDGFGRSDTRVALREYFEVNSRAIVLASLKILCDTGTLDAKIVSDYIAKEKINKDSLAPWEH